MGRYDKIKYFDGSALVNPSQIKIYDGSNFIDYGENNSDNINDFYNYDGNNFNKTLLTKVGGKCISGLIFGSVSERWGTATSVTLPIRFDFEATVKIPNIFQEYNLVSATVSSSDSSGLYFLLDGGLVTIKITKPTTMILHTNTSIPYDGDWHKIKISASLSSASRLLTVKVTIDDGEERTSTFPVTTWSMKTSSYLVIGGNDIKFKDTIKIIGYSSRYGAKTTEIPISDFDVGEQIYLSLSSPDSVITSLNKVENSENWE